MDRCFNCMEKLNKGDPICPKCGTDQNAKMESIGQLPTGTLLNGRYLIGKALGRGGFGITYIAWDNSLQRTVAIKEYLPKELAARTGGDTSVTYYEGSEQSFLKGVERTIDEGRKLAEFTRIESVVTVFNCFRENKTAYIVMEYLEGENAKERLKKIGKFSYDETIKIIVPILEALNEVHKVNLIHRDISPDNIFLCNDGRVKLLDFGSARIADPDEEKSLSVILKHGYAPVEQYTSRGKQGPWTDVYAAGATMYKMLTGITPQESIERLGAGDDLKNISELADIPESAAKAIMKGMSIQARERPQSTEELLRLLNSESALSAETVTIPESEYNLSIGAETVTIPESEYNLSIGAETVTVPESEISAAASVINGINDNITVPQDPGIADAVEGSAENLFSNAAAENKSSKKKLIIGIVAASLAVLAIIFAVIMINSKNNGASREVSGGSAPDLTEATAPQARYKITVNPDINISTVNGLEDSYAEGEYVLLTAIPSDGYMVSGWTGYQTAEGNQIYFSMPAKDIELSVSSAEVTADVAEKEMFYVSISEGAGISGTYGFGTFYAGDEVYVSASSYSGYGTPIWSGYKSGETETMSFIMPAYDVSLSVYAIEKPAQKPVTQAERSSSQAAQKTSYYVSISEGTGIYDTSGSGWYYPGDFVSLSAELSSGYESPKWSGYVTGSLSSISFIMPSKDVSMSVSASKKAASTTTAAPKYTVSVTKGTGVSSVSGTGSYKAGDSVKLSAVLSSGYEKPKWGGDVSSSAASISFTMPSRNVSITVSASAIPTTTQQLINISPELISSIYDSLLNSYSVTVSKGNGIASVSGSGSYKAGATVTLTATLEDGYSLVNWSGIPDNDKKVIGNSVSFTMPSKNVSVSVSSISHSSIDKMMDLLKGSTS